MLSPPVATCATKVAFPCRKKERDKAAAAPPTAELYAFAPPPPPVRLTDTTQPAGGARHKPLLPAGESAALRPAPVGSSCGVAEGASAREACVDGDTEDDTNRDGETDVVGVIDKPRVGETLSEGETLGETDGEADGKPAGT